MSAPPPHSYPPDSPRLGREAKLPVAWRIALAIAATAFLGALLLAFSLKPDPSGMGTHRQIPGFGPCTIQVLLGFPCPACGMTTSWSLLTKGQVAAALQTNASGTMLAAICGVLAIGFLIVAARGKPPRLAPTPLQAAVCVLAWIGLALAEWLVRHGSEIFH